MARKFLTYFSTVSVLHVALLLCGVQLLQNEQLKRDLSPRVLNLKVASMFASSPAPVVAPRTVAPTPKKASVLPVKSDVVSAQDAAIAKGPIAQDGGANGVKGGSADGIATNDAKLIYKTELRGLINENVVYPAVAKRMNVEGVATVSFRVLADGSITNVSLEGSSGNKTLDAAALEAVKKIKRYKAIPSEFATNEMDLSIPIKFKTI